MAFGMKAWLGTAVLALLLVAGWGLAPVQEYPKSRGPLPERMEFLEINRELTLDAWKYQRLFRRDSLVGELRAGLAAGKDIVLGLPSAAADSTVEQTRDAVVRQMDDLNLDRPSMPIGFFALADHLGAFPGLAEPFTFLGRRGEVYLAREGERPYCIIASPYLDRWKDAEADVIAQSLRFKIRIPQDPRQPTNLFGLCRFFARYGSPGSFVLPWLQAGASAFGRSVFPSRYLQTLERGPARAPFGKPGQASFLGGGMRTELCLWGDRKMCDALVMEPVVSLSGVRQMELDPTELLEDSPVDFLLHYPRVEEEMLGRHELFFWVLEEEFGPERFGAFWRSDLPVPDAFAAAFGEPLDLWVMDWLRRYVDPPARGPGVPVQATLITLLGVGFLAGGAVRMGRR